MRLRYLILVVMLWVACDAYGQMSLAEYCDAVVEYSHSISSAMAASDGAEADMRYSQREYYPEVSIGGDADYLFRHMGNVRQWGWALRADVSQPIYRGGSLRAAVRRAESEYDGTRGAEQMAVLKAIYEAEVAYWNMSRASIYYAAIEDYYNVVLSLCDVVSRRYDEGYTSKSDLLQVESRLSDAEYQVSRAQQQYLVAMHNFNLLRGTEADTDVLLSQSIEDLMTMPMRRSSDAVVAEHPNYATSVALSDAARWGVRLRNAEFMPSVSIGLYGLWQPGGGDVAGGGTRLDGGVVLSFSTPIFHFGQRREAVASARSDYRRAQLAVEDVRDEIVLNESNGWTNMVSTYQRVETAQRSLDVARENLDISTYSYSEGLATILDVLQAQISWLQIYQNSIAAQYDYAVAITAYKYIVADFSSF